MANKPVQTTRQPAAHRGPAQPKPEEAKIMVPGSAPLAKEKLPEHLQRLYGNNAGVEEAEQDDLVIPRLVLTQDGTPQRKKGDPKYIPGLETGMFFNSVTGEIYGESIDFVPLFLAKNNIKFLEPLGSGIDCMSYPDDKVVGGQAGRLCPEGCRQCEHFQFGSGKNGGKACTEYKGFVSLVRGIPCGVSTHSTGITPMKNMITTIKMSHLPAYAFIWNATHTPQTKRNNTYEQWVLTRKAPVPADFLEAAESYFKSLKAQGVRIDTSGEEDTSFDTEQM